MFAAMPLLYMCYHRAWHDSEQSQSYILRMNSSKYWYAWTNQLIRLIQSFRIFPKTTPEPIQLAASDVTDMTNLKFKIHHGQNAPVLRHRSSFTAHDERQLLYFLFSFQRTFARSARWPCTNAMRHVVSHNHLFGWLRNVCTSDWHSYLQWFLHSPQMCLTTQSAHMPTCLCCRSDNVWMVIPYIYIWFTSPTHSLSSSLANVFRQTLCENRKKNRNTAQQRKNHDSDTD